MFTLKNRFLLIYFIFKRFSFLLLLTVGITVGLSAQEQQVASDTQLQQPQSSNQVQSSQTEIQTQSLDTLTAAYSDKWQGVETGEELSTVEQVLGSNNLIFVVLTVSLIIWFVLLTFLIRLDKKVTRIEKSTLK